MSRSCWAWETLIAGRCPCWSMWWGGWRIGQQAEPLVPSNQLPLRFYRCWKWCGSQVSVRMILWCCGQRSACAFLFFFFALRWSGGPCRGRLWSSSALVIWDVRVDDVGTPHYLEVWIKASARGCLSFTACSLIMFPCRRLKVAMKATVTHFPQLYAHFTNLERKGFPYKVTDLPVFKAILWEVWKVGVSRRHFRLGKTSSGNTRNAW